MDDKKIPINVDLSAKVELKGEASTKAVDRSVNALLDAIAPFTEGMGLIGDHLRAHRYDTAVKIARKAQSIAREQKLVLEPPPLKFTVPFLENASLEDIDDALVEAWSRLLVAASNNYEGKYLAFVQILAALGPDEADFLTDIAALKRKERSHISLHEIVESYEYAIEEIANLNSEVQDLEWASEAHQNSAIGMIEKLFDSSIDEPCQPITIIAEYHRTNEKTVTRWTTGMTRGATSAALLERQNLISVEQRVVHTKFGLLEIDLACLTPLGWEFYGACSEDRAINDVDDDSANES